MHAHIKYALIATGVVLAVVGLLNLKCPRQRPATLSQVPPPVDERAAFDALVEEYISKNSPQAVDKKIAEALSTSVRRLEGNVMTLDRAQVERALTILARNQPSQIAADFLNEVISTIQTSTELSDACRLATWSPVAWPRPRLRPSLPRNCAIFCPIPCG